MKILVLAIVVMSGCRKQPAANDASAPEASAEEGARPTLERFQEVAQKVTPSGPWAEGFDRIRARLGEPTLIEGDTYTWAISGGGWCTYLWIIKETRAKPEPHDVIDDIGEAKTVLEVRSQEWYRCLRGTGAKPETFEDPNVASPPEDGLTTIEAFEGGMIGARSRWLDHAITLEGTVTNRSYVMTPNGLSVVSLRSRPEAKAMANCYFRGGDPDEYAEGDRLRIRGRAFDFHGHREPGLSDCVRERIGSSP